MLLTAEIQHSCGRLNRTSVEALGHLPTERQGPQVEGKRYPGGWSCEGSLDEDGSLNGLWRRGPLAREDIQGLRR